MKYLQLDHVDLFSLHGINNRELLDWSLKKNGCLAAARQLQKEGRVRFIGFSTHATTDVILEAVNSGEFDYCNVHWYFVNDLNWAAIEAAHRLDMGVFIISPNDKGGKLYEPPPKMVELCAPLSPMEFNDLYCLARPEVHTLELRRDNRAILTSTSARWSFTTKSPRPSRRLKNGCARKWSACSARIGARDGLKACRIMWTCPAKSMFPKSCGCGLTRNRSTSWPGARCGTTCSARPTIGFPARTRRRCAKLDLRTALGQSPFAGRVPGILEDAHRMLFEQPVQRLSAS